MAEQADDACIPNLFWQATQPVPNLAQREWMVAGFDSLDVEASIWLTWAIERYGADVTVGVITLDNGWGELLLDAIE